jgi:phenylpyruvate tautomerase PptA (4-oxalocrotonate tautomerase family)
MPFVEILAPATSASVKQSAIHGITQGIMSAFAVGADTVTVFFVSVAPGDYAHAGSLGANGRGQRVLVKLHAFRRTLQQRRAAAEAVTAAVATAYAMPAEDIAVYFFDRGPDEVAHAGRMACD